MTRKTVWLLVSSLIVITLLVTSCTPRVTDEEEIVPPAEEAAAAEEHYVQAHNLHKEGRYDEAIKEYTKAIELDPNYAIAYAERGQAYFKLGQYDLAILKYLSTANKTQ